MPLSQIPDELRLWGQEKARQIIAEISTRLAGTTTPPGHVEKILVSSELMANTAWDPPKVFAVQDGLTALAYPAKIEMVLAGERHLEVKLLLAYSFPEKK